MLRGEVSLSSVIYASASPSVVVVGDLRWIIFFFLFFCEPFILRLTGLPPGLVVFVGLRRRYYSLSLNLFQFTSYSINGRCLLFDFWRARMISSSFLRARPIRWFLSGLVRERLNHFRSLFFRIYASFGWNLVWLFQFILRRRYSSCFCFFVLLTFLCC